MKDRRLHRIATLFGEVRGGLPRFLCAGCDAGVTKPPILDWFHIAMRLQHATQAASGLSADNLGRAQATAVIVAEDLPANDLDGRAKLRRLRATRTMLQDAVAKPWHTLCYVAAGTVPDRLPGWPGLSCLYGE